MAKVERDLSDCGIIRKDGNVYRYTADYDEDADCWYGEVFDEDYKSFGRTGYGDTYQEAIQTTYGWIEQHEPNLPF